jgi:ABC-type phosphate/phosphonate transport system permease subunit
MHAKDELVEKIGETYGYMSHMLDRKMEEYKLAAAEKSALTVSKLIMVIVMTILGVVMATFGLIAFAFFLAGDMQNSAKGFGIVALIMLVLMVIVFLLRRYIIINPAVAKTISLFFSESENEANNEQSK